MKNEVIELCAKVLFYAIFDSEIASKKTAKEVKEALTVIFDQAIIEEAINYFSPKADLTAEPRKE